MPGPARDTPPTYEFSLWRPASHPPPSPLRRRIGRCVSASWWWWWWCKQDSASDPSGLGSDLCFVVKRLFSSTLRWLAKHPPNLKKNLLSDEDDPSGSKYTRMEEESIQDKERFARVAANDKPRPQKAVNAARQLEKFTGKNCVDFTETSRAGKALLTADVNFVIVGRWLARDYPGVDSVMHSGLGYCDYFTTDLEVPVLNPGASRSFCEALSLELGHLGLVMTNVELLERKSSGSDLENLD
uniref:Uncharacterized protein n=1 Tax=Timema monikensis TaxID=170555 RepID=A0A7R9E9V0_9NEOP|nr:unnamed protein product [Timema monikensis]